MVDKNFYGAFTKEKARETKKSWDTPVAGRKKSDQGKQSIVIAKTRVH